MNRAVERIICALQRNETIFIYGDNDVDGITGTALLLEFIQLIGGNVYYYVTHQSFKLSFETNEALELAIEKKCTLLITVDRGITHPNDIQTIIRNHIDVIITDHHEPIHSIPGCIATLNPKLKNSTYPNRDLTGVGVAFKLAHAITNKLISTGKMSRKKIDLKHFLDLVALGTIADMGVLKGENRILIRYGLKQFAHTKRLGLFKLMEACQVEPQKITPCDIALKIAPRLNSLGRISDSRKGVQLMLVKDPIHASRLVEELEANNARRQQIDRQDSEEIEAYLKACPELLNQKAIALCSDQWHPGIIPIICARLAKQYNRPTLIIAIEKGIGKGSIRTIPEFPISFNLFQKTDLLMSFGGHDYAAGLIIKEGNIPQFKAYFLEQSNKILKIEDIIPKLYLDASIEFKDLIFHFLDSMQLLEPYGVGNPPPIFYTDVQQTWLPKATGKTHLKFYLKQKEHHFEGIGFGLIKRREALLEKNGFLTIAFTPQTNSFFNKSTIQLIIKYFKINRH